MAFLLNVSCSLKYIFFSLVQVFCVAVEVFNKHIFVVYFFLFLSGLSLVAFPIHWNNGWSVEVTPVLWNIQCKVDKNCFVDPVFVQTQSYERAAEKGVSVLVLGKAGAAWELFCGQVVKMPGVRWKDLVGKPSVNQWESGPTYDQRHTLSASPGTYISFRLTPVMEWGWTLFRKQIFICLQL